MEPGQVVADRPLQKQQTRTAHDIPGHVSAQATARAPGVIVLSDLCSELRSLRSACYLSLERELSALVFCIAYCQLSSAAPLLQLATMATRFAAFAQRSPLVAAHPSPAGYSHLSRPGGCKQPCFQPLPPRGVQRVIPAHKLSISKLILLLSTLPLRTPLAALDSGDPDGENNHGRLHDAVLPPLFRPGSGAMVLQLSSRARATALPNGHLLEPLSVKEGAQRLAAPQPTPHTVQPTPLLSAHTAVSVSAVALALLCVSSN